MRGRKGLTPIELSVVISTIALVAGVVIASSNLAREEARLQHCLNNLRQLGLIFRVYMQDNDHRFFYRDVIDYDDIGLIDWGALFDYGDGAYTYGGADPHARHCGVRFPQAMIRPFYQYVKDFEVFHCPADRGEVKPYPCDYWKPSNFFAVGTSYRYNYWPWGNPTMEPMADPWLGIANQKQSWVPDPSRYILLHESPALKLNYYGGAYYLWHFARGETTLLDPELAESPFISNILFVDGHADTFDFTDNLINNDPYICEPTDDWVWYKPGEENP